MHDLFWEEGKDVFENEKRRVKYLESKDGSFIFIKDYTTEKSIQLDKKEAKEIHDEIRLIRFEPKLESKLPLKVKGIIFENEKQIKGLSLTLSKFIG